jgi:hypothetical protein
MRRPTGTSWRATLRQRRRKSLTRIRSRSTDRNCWAHCPLTLLPTGETSKMTPTRRSLISSLMSASGRTWGRRCLRRRRRGRSRRRRLPGRSTRGRRRRKRRKRRIRPR